MQARRPRRGVAVVLGCLALLAMGCDPEVPPPFPSGNPTAWDADDGRWQTGGSVIPITAYDPATQPLTAIIADSTVNLHDGRWLDETIVTSEGNPVLPIVADGPIWRYSVSGSVFTQADPLFPIDQVLGVDETPDRLVIAQGANDAHPVWHGGWTALDEARFDQSVATAGAGVACIVVVTPGYKAGPGDPEGPYGPADAAERANLDAAATWLRAKAASNPRFVLADWHALGVPHPEWWLNDLHTNEAGSDQYEALVTRALRDCPGEFGCATPGTTMSTKLVEAAYADFLHRSVTSGELAYWVPDLATTGYCRTALFGQLAKDDAYSGEVIGGLYQQLLGRTAAPAEIDGWRAGIEAQTLTVAGLMEHIVASPEFSDHAGPGSAAFVDHVFTTVLGRLPSAADRTYWAGQVDALGKRAVGRSIIRSGESRDRRAAALGQRFLGRPYTPLEATYWRTVLGQNGGNDVAVAVSLAKLPEYRRLAQAR